MLEILYSSGLRRTELLQLRLYDVDQKHGLITVRQGKGKRDKKPLFKDIEEVEMNEEQEKRYKEKLKK